jgi:hypothetical protein
MNGSPRSKLGTLKSALWCCRSGETEFYSGQILSPQPNRTTPQSPPPRAALSFGANTAKSRRLPLARWRYPLTAACWLRGSLQQIACSACSGRTVLACAFAIYHWPGSATDRQPASVARPMLPIGAGASRDPRVQRYLAKSYGRVQGEFETTACGRCPRTRRGNGGWHRTHVTSFHEISFGRRACAAPVPASGAARESTRSSLVVRNDDTRWRVYRRSVSRSRGW